MKRGESNQSTQTLLSPQVQHLFCFRQRSLSPPLRGGGRDEVIRGQDPFSSLARQWVVSVR